MGNMIISKEEARVSTPQRGDNKIHNASETNGQKGY
jgi:hypothetical protein